MRDIYLLIEGKQEGPYTEEQLQLSLSSGLVEGSSLAWKQGLPDWISVESLLNKDGEMATPKAMPNELQDQPVHTAVDENPKEAPFTEPSKTVKITSDDKKSEFMFYKYMGVGAVALILLGLSIGAGIGLIISKADSRDHSDINAQQTNTSSPQGEVFRVYQPATSPDGAWFGFLDRSDSPTINVIIDFGNGVTIADDDRIDGVFVPTDQTGVWNNDHYRIYKVQGTFTFEHPAQ